MPELVTTLNTVADAQNIAALSNGDIVIGSATGDGLQVIPAAEVNSAIDNPDRS